MMKTGTTKSIKKVLTFVWELILGKPESGEEVESKVETTKSAMLTHQSRKWFEPWM